MKNTYQNSNTSKIKLDKSEEKTNRSNDSNSSQSWQSGLSIHKRRKTVFLPLLSRNKSNNDSTPNLNQRSDSESSGLSKKNFNKFDLKRSINYNFDKSSKSRKLSNFKAQSKEPK